MAACLAMLIVAIPLLPNQKPDIRQTGKSGQEEVPQGICTDEECRGLVRPSKKKDAAFECLACHKTFDSLPGAGTSAQKPEQPSSQADGAPAQGGATQ